MEMASPSADHVLLLGAFQIIRDGAQLPLPRSRKARALLAYLAMAPRPVTREKLCELFWDVADDPKSELRWCLSSSGHWSTGPQRPGSSPIVSGPDRHQFAQHRCHLACAQRADDADQRVAAGSSVAESIVPWRLLKAFPSTGLPCSTWLSRQRHRFGEWRQLLLERLGAVLPPESDDRIEVLRECIEVAPFDEVAHIELVRTLLLRALYAEAEHQIDASVTLFQNEGIDPASLKAAFRQPNGRFPSRPE